MQEVILHHVAQRPDLVVERPAAFHADGLGRGDLHAADVAAVEHRLEDAVAEAERQHVLHGIFAEVVVDAVNLVGREVLADLPVQLQGAGLVVAERLLDDDACPGPLRSVRQAGLVQPGDERGEVFRGGRQVKHRARPLFGTDSQPA